MGNFFNILGITNNDNDISFLENRTGQFNILIELV